MPPSKIVIDTNVVIAGALARRSNPARAIGLALQSAEVLVSAQSLSELNAVFRRPKFDRYSDLFRRLEYLDAFFETSTPIFVTHIVKTCRDPKDNMVLELTLSGQTDLIITGDSDLLSLDTWQNIPILTPSAYLDSQH